MRRRITRVTTLLVAAAAAALALLTGTSSVGAAPAWAPEASATLTPGVMAYTAGAQCTANFIFTDARRHVCRPGRALLGHRRGDRDQRLHVAVAAARHAGHFKRRW